MSPNGCGLKRPKMGYISIQNAKKYENIHLRGFILRMHIGERKKKKFSELKMRFLIPRTSKSLANMIFV